MNVTRCSRRNSLTEVDIILLCLAWDIRDVCSDLGLMLLETTILAAESRAWRPAVYNLGCQREATSSKFAVVVRALVDEWRIRHCRRNIWIARILRVFISLCSSAVFIIPLTYRKRVSCLLFFSFFYLDDNCATVVVHLCQRQQQHQQQEARWSCAAVGCCWPASTASSRVDRSRLSSWSSSLDNWAVTFLLVLSERNRPAAVRCVK